MLIAPRSFFIYTMNNKYMMSHISISKPHIPKDLVGIQEVFYTTWLATYPNVEYGITREDVEERFRDRCSEKKLSELADTLEVLPSGYLFLVARDGDIVVGICRLIKHTEYNQLHAIYVLPTYQRHGIGQMFWDEAQKFFDQSKDTIVRVAVYNTPAISFYTKLGFVDTGKRIVNEK